MESSLRAQEEIIEIYRRYSDMIYRIAFLYLKNSFESEDALQNVFLKLIRYNGKFDSEEHLKAWLIVTAKNVCKDMLKNFWRRNRVGLEQAAQHLQTDVSVQNEIYQAVMTLRSKYRIPLYLYYYEGYSTAEISDLLDINHSYYGVSQVLYLTLCSRRSIRYTVLRYCGLVILITTTQMVF